jgi:hypothetical protein
MHSWLDLQYGRIHCDLRSYDDDQVRQVYDWFVREAVAGARPSTGTKD